MANKTITDLQLRDEVSDDCNIPTDDGLQTYRLTMAMVRDWIYSNLPDGLITSAKTNFTPFAQTFYGAGSNSYNVPAGTKRLEFILWGGGGGGAGSATVAGNNHGSGTNGGNTTINTTLLVAGGGGGGGGTGSGIAGQGGAYGFTSPALILDGVYGSYGGNSYQTSSGAGGIGAPGGGNPRNGIGIGGAPATAGGGGQPNSGAGGGSGGAGGTCWIGGAGGAGGWVHAEILEADLLASYTCVVGAGGTQGAAGTGGNAGGPGAAGGIIIRAHFE